jgi:hypothetical protein
MRSRAVVAIYVVLAAAPFAFDAAHGWFWRQHHYRAPVYAAVVGILLCVLVLRRRWAWGLLVLFDGIVVVSYSWEWLGALPFAVSLATFLFLVSPPMRRYVAERALRTHARESGLI